MTQAHADRTNIRSIRDRESVGNEQTYRKRHGYIPTHRTKERRKQEPTNSGRFLRGTYQ